MDITPKSKKAMTKNEVALLVDLIASKPILTSKETNATTNRNKEEAWISLTVEFNSKCIYLPRSKEQLKLKWDNLKKVARKRAQQIRMNTFKTGGGRPDYVPPDEVLKKVAGVLGSTCSGFDSAPETPPITSQAKKRKIEKENIPSNNFLHGMSKMAIPIQTRAKGQKKKIEDTGRRELNLAMARYYDRKSELLEVQIQLAKAELAEKTKLT